MRIPSAHYTAYREKIEECISTGEFSWSTLVEAIRKTKFVPKNWMTVRAVLAQFIQEGFIVRDPDLSKEVYIATNKGD